MRPEEQPDIGGSVDVCIVGSGASGAVVAYELVRAGLRVLVIEAGARLSATDSLADVEPSWETALVRGEDGRWTSSGRPWTARLLGGGMSLFAGIAFRYRHVDFDAGSYAAADALNPAWPVGYATLVDHYNAIEGLLGVARSTGVDPTEPASDVAVMPPHPFSARGRLLAEAGLMLGLRPFPTPLAINSIAYEGRPACHGCGRCNEYPCVSGAKASVVPLLLEPAAVDGLLTVIVQAKALRLVSASADRVAGVEWLDLRRRSRHITWARVVVLAANAVQSAALLLRSQDPFAPEGIGNRYGMVGRGLSLKVSGYVSGQVPIRRLERGPPDGPFSTVSFTDHYIDPECPSGLGGLLYEASPPELAIKQDTATLRLHYLAGDQPMSRNCVRLSSTHTELEAPKIVMDYRTHPLDVRRMDYLASRASLLLEAAGATAITREASDYQRGSRHLHGTCRAGDDPRDSVVDRLGRVHTVENVYVADGGFFPFAGGANPTLTIQANARRIAAHLARELGAEPVVPDAGIPVKGTA